MVRRTKAEETNHKQCEVRSDPHNNIPALPYQPDHLVRFKTTPNNNQKYILEVCLQDVYMLVINFKQRQNGKVHQWPIQINKLMCHVQRHLSSVNHIHKHHMSGGLHKNLCHQSAVGCPTGDAWYKESTGNTGAVRPTCQNEEDDKIARQRGQAEWGCKRNTPQGISTRHTSHHIEKWLM